MPNSQKLIALAIFLFSLSFISSAQININPSSILIQAYPGETHYQNFSITTDGNYAVYLIAQSPANITINYTSPIIVERNKVISLGFYLPTGIVPGVYAINLTGSIDVADTPIIITQVNEIRGGGGLVYRDKVIYKNNTIDNPILIKKITELENEIIVLKNDTTKLTPILEGKSIMKYFWLVIIILVIIVLLIYLIKIIRDKVKKDE